MSVFTKRSKEVLDTQKYSFSKSVFVKVDSKGRISIPSFLRKNLDLQTGDSLELIFDLSINCFIVQNGVIGSTKDCESFSSSSSLDSGLFSGRRNRTRRDFYER